MVDGRIRFDAADSNARSDGAERVDHVAVYCAELDQLYLVARDTFDSSISLRVEEPEQPNSRINWADDYEFTANWPP